MDFASVVEGALARRLRSESPTQRRLAAEAFVPLGAIDEADALLAALGDADSAVRAAATWALWRNGTEAVRERLESTGQDARPEVRACAVAALMHLADGDERLSLLRRALMDTEWIVRHGAIDELMDLAILEWSRTSPGVARLALPALRDLSPEVREVAALLFLEIPVDSNEVQEELLSLAEADSSRCVRVMAAGAVAKIVSDRAVNVLFSTLLSADVDRDRDSIEDIASSLAKHPLRELVQSRLSAALHSSMSANRARAAIVLAQIATSGRLDRLIKLRLIELTGDPSSEVRESALYGILDMTWDRAAPPSQSELEAMLAVAAHLALEDDAAEVRAAAAAILAENIDERSVGVINSAASDSSPSVRSAALNFFTAAAWELAKPITYRALDDTEAEVRRHAAEVISRRADSTAIPLLLRALPNTPAARGALWKIAERLHQPDSLADPST